MMERLDKVKGQLAYIILMLARRTGIDSQRIEADINEKAKSNDWRAGFDYWSDHMKAPFIPSNGLLEQYEQGQADLYEGFCSVAGGMVYSLATRIGCDDYDEALEWAEGQLLDLAWLGGTIASVRGERGRAKQTGAMTGALKATPEDVLQRTHDLYWENMRELRHDKNARIKTGIQIAELEGRSKPLSERAVFDRLKKHKERTKT